MRSRFDGKWLSRARRAGSALGCLFAVFTAACDDRRLAPSGPGAPMSPAAAAPAGAPPGAPVSRVEREGLSIAFELRSPAGEPAAEPTARSEATAVFTITDAATGAPARGLRPLGWMSKRGDGEAPDDEGCRAKVKSFMAGLLAEVPDVDMNGSLIWTLNHDSSLSVINPQVAFSKTRLRNLISLSGRPSDWALHPDRSRVFVSVPERGTVAVVDTRRSLALANVPVGERPSRVAVAPDGHTVWVGNDGDGTVSVLDVASSRVVKTLTVGKGHHEIAFSDEGRTAWVTSRDAADVRAIDAATLEVTAEVEVGEGAVSLAASEPARAVYVANEVTGEVVVIDAARREATQRIASRPGVSKVAFAPGGRFAFVLVPRANEVTVVDSATGRGVHTLGGFQGPDALAFTGAYAYVRNRDSTTVSLVDLHALGGASPPPVVQVQVGQKVASTVRGAGSVSSSPFVPTREGNGMWIASPADLSLFFYVEGMMAPMGTLQTYGREARGVLAVDRTLEEVEPGVYATPVRLKGAGLHDVALLLDRPRAAVCLAHEVAPSPDGDDEARARLSIEAAFDPGAPLAAGAPATLRFRLADPTSPEPIDPKSVHVLVTRFPGSWRWQGAPQGEPVAGVDNSYSVTFTPPAPGAYRMLVAVPSRGAPLGALPSFQLRVTEGDALLPVTETKTKIGGAEAGEAERAAARYFTNTELVDQNGVPHRFYDGLVRGRKVLIHFAFTSCKGVCPAMISNLARVQKLLGPRLGREVVILTVTVDPVNDTPAVLKELAGKIGAAPGWYFLTGTSANVKRVLSRLGGAVEKPEEHGSTLLVGDARSGYWVKSIATARPEDIVHLVDHISDDPGGTP